MRLLAAKPRSRSSGVGTAHHRARRLCGVGLASALLLLTGLPAVAQKKAPDRAQAIAQRSVSPQALRTKLNRETLVIAAGRPGTSYLRMASDLAAAVGASESLRILPLAADGGAASLQDLLVLRGVDLAIVPANVLAHARATDAFGGALPEKIAYVTALYSEGVHVIAGRRIATVHDLNGKKVAIPAGDGAVRFTVSDIFRRLGIAARSVPMHPADALDGVRTGRLAAVLLVGDKPLAQVSALPKDGSLHLLNLPFLALPGEGYSPAVFLPEDYPALIPPGAIVETVAIKALLMATKTRDDAERRLAEHTPALLEAIGGLAVSERHPQWKDVNLGAVLPGWYRLGVAERWLNQAFTQRKEERRERNVAPRPVAKPVESSRLAPLHRRKKLFDAFEARSHQSESARTAAK